MDQTSARKEIELSRTPVEIKSGEWALKVVPGGRIISMEHIPTGKTNLLTIFYFWVQKLINPAKHVLIKLLKL